MSGSSKALREELKASQVENHVPSVDNSVAVWKYFEHANQLYKESVETYKKGEWRYSYVQFMIFLHFSVLIRKHNGFNLAQHIKSKHWLKRANDSAFKMIEVVISRLDEIEDRILQEQEDLLNNEFYGSSDDEQGPSAPANEPQPDPSPMPMPGESTDSPIDALSDAASDIALEFPVSEEPKPSVSATVADSNSSSVALSKALSVLKTDQKEQPTPLPDTENKGSQYSMIGLEDLLLLEAALDGVRNGMYRIPAPHRQTLELTMTGCQFFCNKDDFFVSFTSFLHFLPPEWQLFRSVVETNRCFFIHLGIATGFHPFILQTYFRHWATKNLRSLPPDDMQCEILNSVLLYAGFVDANVLCLLWPREFSERKFRICFLCGSLNRPMFISFTPDDDATQATGGAYYDILLYCDGSHFTFLEVTQARHGSCSTSSAGGIIDQLLWHAKDSKYIVQEHSVKYNSSIGDLLLSVNS